MNGVAGLAALIAAAAFKFLNQVMQCRICEIYDLLDWERERETLHLHKLLLCTFTIYCSSENRELISSWKQELMLTTKCNYILVNDRLNCMTMISYIEFFVSIKPTIIIVMMMIMKCRSLSHIYGVNRDWNAAVASRYPLIKMLLNYI